MTHSFLQIMLLYGASNMPIISTLDMIIAAVGESQFIDRVVLPLIQTSAGGLEKLAAPA